MTQSIKEKLTGEDEGPVTGPGPPQKSGINWKMIAAIALFWFLLFYFFTPARQPTMPLPYSKFKNKVQEGQVQSITVKGEEVTGRFNEPVKGEPTQTLFGGKEAPEFESFKTIIPGFGDKELMTLLEENEVVVNAKSDQRSWFWVLVVNVLPWVLIIGFFVYSSRKFQERMGGAGGMGPFSIGKSKAKLYTRFTSNVTFEDVAGLENAKKELLEVVEFLKDPSKFKSLGGELPKGILLVGPPGVGKTLIARGIAGEAGVPFYSISGSEFIEMFVGVGASRVRDMFKNAKKEAPTIIFIDELDSIGRVRGTGVGGGHDEREQTLNQILSEMDGFSPQEDIIVMAATNRPDVLDPALVRPGRFDRQITLELPQRKARVAILKVHTKDMPLADDVDLERVAGMTVGFSGADLKNLANEAALLAARHERKQVTAADFSQARDKITMGVEREDFVRDEEKKIIAHHEAGHALVARFYAGADPLEKVTIIPRGRSLGATELIPEEDRYNLTRSYVLGRIAVLLGGRTAEQLILNDVSSGAGDDLKKATELARRMVCQWGMSEKLGPMTFQQGEPHPFLGREMAQPKDFSEETARLIDEEIRDIIKNTQQEVRDILESHQTVLEALAQELLDKETLTREEVDGLIEERGGS
ncbi:MAG: ATP-dependent zinc metalloprotease FtsH [Desulfatiglandaceae bacterium]